MTLSDNAQLQEIDAQTLKEGLEEGSIVLVDVREPGEYAHERIPGANLHPLSHFAPDQVLPPPGQRLVLYCQSGNRSSRAAQQLLDAKLTAVSHLRGGLTTWKNAGYRVEKSENAPISLFRQVQIVAGSFVALGTVLSAFISPWFLLLTGFVGCGLVFAGITNTCAMSILLARLPYNQREKSTTLVWPDHSSTRSKSKPSGRR